MRHLLVLLLLFTTLYVHAEGNYKLELVDGKYVCQGSSECNTDNKKAFGSAVLWLLEQQLDGKSNDAHRKIDTKNYTVKARMNLDCDGNEVVQNYTFDLIMRVAGGKLDFNICNIRCTPRNFLAGLTNVSLDKINLTKKPKQKVYIDNFDAVCNKYVSDMLAVIRGTNVDLSHWEAIQQGQVVKGMSENECVLAVGKPDNVTSNSQRVQWQYESGMIIVFEGGKVSAVVK